MAKLVNLGSLCIDSVYSVPNLAGAGETVASLDSAIYPGGKGLNQSIAAAFAGAEVAHFGAVGDDGDLLLNTLAESGVDTAGVARLEGQSGHAVIQVDSQGRNSIVISGGTNRRLEASIIDAAFAATAPDDWLLLQNEINDLTDIIRQAHERGLKTALNLAPADARIEKYPLELLDVLIVNEIEAMAAARCDDVDRALQILAETLPRTSIVLTEGETGLRFVDAATGETGSLGAFSVDAVDETAAGDSFVGYAMAGLVRGDPLESVLLEASAAGALAVTAKGAATAIPHRDTVADLVGSASPETKAR